MDELEEVFKDGLITPKDFDLALDTKKKLENGLLSNVEAFEADCMKCLNMIETLSH